MKPHYYRDADGNTAVIYERDSYYMIARLYDDKVREFRVDDFPRAVRQLDAFGRGWKELPITSTYDG